MPTRGALADWDSKFHPGDLCGGTCLEQKGKCCTAGPGVANSSRALRATTICHPAEEDDGDSHTRSCRTCLCKTWKLHFCWFFFLTSLLQLPVGTSAHGLDPSAHAAPEKILAMFESCLNTSKQTKNHLLKLPAVSLKEGNVSTYIEMIKTQIFPHPDP